MKDAMLLNNDSTSVLTKQKPNYKSQRWKKKKQNICNIMVLRLSEHNNLLSVVLQRLLYCLADCLLYSS